MRIKFKKGKQREFLKIVLERINSPSLRLLNQFGFNINYQTLKSYYNENRTLPKDFFEQLCILGKIDKNKLDYLEIEENWGQIKGGKS
jgi:hypothetical protein